MRSDLAVVNISQLVTLDFREGKEPLRGKELSQIGVIRNGFLLIKDGKILDYGSSDKFKGRFDADIIIDGTGKVVTPGLVDPHTHPIFNRSRENEFRMKIEGSSYMEIARQGGGINSTVRSVRDASLEELVNSGKKHLDWMLQTGTTTAEAKSGYGLSVESEIKQLKVIEILNQEHLIDLVPTFLGAHEIPPEYTNKKAKYIDIIVTEMLQSVMEKGLAEYCDVFCEKGVFELDDCRRILGRARELGFKLKMHADEFEPLGGAELGVELEAVSVDHLLAVSESGIENLGKSDTIAVMLPGTSFFLDLKKYAPARKLAEANAIIGLATDFNPGSSPTTNMQLILSLACIKLKLSPAETLAAATLNNAFAVGKGFDRGSISPGKIADILIWNVDNFEKIPYYYGVNLLDKVIKRGQIVVNNAAI
ncbi:imidazolonepropionase [bacterium]|nr:imidazolonepropionase [bacterium]